MLTAGIWMMTFLLSLAALIFAAAANAFIMHMVVAGSVAVVFATTAVGAEQKLRSENANETLIAASNARHMGFVWAWGACALVLTYTSILKWHEWMTFFFVFAGAAILCLFFSNILRREADSPSDDGTVTKLARYLAIAQLVGMVIAMVGLVIDGKMQRYLDIRAGWEDWAANNIFFFGALALAIISANALYRSRSAANTDSSST